MVNTVKSSDILTILKDHQKKHAVAAETEESTKYKPYHKMNRKEKDLVDHVMEELQLKERMVAAIAAQDLGDTALDPGKILKVHIQVKNDQVFKCVCDIKCMTPITPCMILCSLQCISFHSIEYIYQMC